MRPTTPARYPTTGSGPPEGRGRVLFVRLPASSQSPPTPSVVFVSDAPIAGTFFILFLLFVCLPPSMSSRRAVGRLVAIAGPEVRRELGATCGMLGTSGSHTGVFGGRLYFGGRQGSLWYV